MPPVGGVAILFAVAAFAAPPRLVTVASDSKQAGPVPPTRSFNNSVLPNAGGKGRNGFLSMISFAADSFGIRLAPKGSPNGLAKTSETANVDGCAYATNGGPFSFDSGACTGVVISNGTEIATNYSTEFNIFGLTNGGDWILGSLNSSAEARSMGVREAVTGFYWLVYDGASVVNTTGGEAAPRTAIGVTREGSLLLFQVDGCEKCLEGKGPTVAELAELMASPAVGALHAVNLDGGGSAVTVIGGDVVSYPTCDDIGIKCERSVASITCVN